MNKESILVIGAGGQIGVELTNSLRQAFGQSRVIAADIKPTSVDLLREGPYEQLDVLDKKAFGTLVDRHQVSQVYLLAAMLSATGEKHPQKAWELNMQSLLNTLDLAREKKMAKVFWPSSIAVFGPGAPRRKCPQKPVLDPTTIYGISKAAGEAWVSYYWKRYGVDTRSLRYPGLISHSAQPGGGTTDYAVDIFHQALAGNPYTCFLQKHTHLPMMYMPDAIRATMELMEAPSADLSIRSSYNVAAMSFSPAQLATAIQQYIPGFTIDYRPDERQIIADSWPESIDDSPAREDWKWEYEYGLSAMTKDMLYNLAQKATGTSGIPAHQQPLFY